MRTADGVVAKRVGEEMVLLDVERGVYYGLDPVGARMWELACAGIGRDEALDRLLDEYDTTRETLARDFDRLLGELRAKGLIAD